MRRCSIQTHGQQQQQQGCKGGRRNKGIDKEFVENKGIWEKKEFGEYFGVKSTNVYQVQMGTKPAKVGRFCGRLASTCWSPALLWRWLGKCMPRCACAAETTHVSGRVVFFTGSRADVADPSSYLNVRNTCARPLRALLSSTFLYN